MNATLFIVFTLLISHFANAQFYDDTLTVQSKPESLLICPRKITAKPEISFVEPTKNIVKSDSTAISEINFRCCRCDSTYFYIDGVKVYSSKISDHIEEIKIITGGIPGEYGDINGGVIRVESRKKK